MRDRFRSIDRDRFRDRFRDRDRGRGRFIALSLEFLRTLKIIAKMLREVVNRVKLGHHYARRGSRG